MPNNTSEPFTCNLTSFHASYARLHGYLSLLVCLFGSLANVLNILVLTRREMRSPTNLILTGLALADLLVMLDYVPYSVHIHVYHRPRVDTFTYPWALFVLFHSNFGQVCHTVAIWLTLALAVWRYLAVAHPQVSRRWCTNRTTVWTIVGAYLACPLICLPLYVTTEVRGQVETVEWGGQRNYTLSAPLDGRTSPESRRNVTLYFVRLTETAKRHGVLEELNFWMYSVVIKLLPCLVLTILSAKLLCVLLEAKSRRKKLISKDDGPEARGRRERQTDRTTMMLLAVLLLFLITELPQGILGLLSVLLGPPFFRTCYLMLGDVIDILTLVNSAINFILYCSMSRQFRTTFDQLFCRKVGGIEKRRKCRRSCVENNGNGPTNQTMTHVTQV